MCTVNSAVNVTAHCGIATIWDWVSKSSQNRLFSALLGAMAKSTQSKPEHPLGSGLAGPDLVGLAEAGDRLKLSCRSDISVTILISNTAGLRSCISAESSNRVTQVT